MHFPWGLSITAASYAVAYRGFGWDRTQSTLFGLGATAAATLTKEALDELRYGGWDWKDAVWSAAGAAAGAVIMNYLTETRGRDAPEVR